MITHTSDAIVLRTYPFREGDLLVTIFTRQHGKIRGVAKSALRSRKRFGGALEPMTHVRAHYAERPRQELLRLDSFEIVTSPLSEPVDYARAAGLAFLAEALDETLPDHDAHDAVFRLTLAALAHLQTDCIWMPLTYFALWMTRLMGWLPELHRCVECGDRLKDGAYFHATRDGLFCAVHRRASATRLSAESLALAETISRRPISELAHLPLERSQAADLRRFLVQILERHMERKLKSAVALQRLK
jgi:DNA repair protein RecO (recombination protein O)